MTSKIKVDNIENQCGGAVITKCGGTTTIAGTNVNATTVTATNVVGSTAVKSNAIQASDGGNLVSQSGTTITLGASGDTIELASGASQSGFGRTGTVDWNTTPKTATFTAVSGDGFFANTTGSAFNMNLPAGTAGAIVSVADYAATWDSNPLTVVPNGSDKIGGVNANTILNTEGQSVTFVFVDSTQGWINTMDSTSNARGAAFMTATGGSIATVGNCKIHTFTGPGTFTVCSVGTPSTNNIVSYLVVAGGGGGGRRNNADAGGGGGGGGFREFKADTTPYTASPLNGNPGGTSITVTATAFPITVGAGGAPGTGPSPGTFAGIGGNSIFSTVTSTGGGGGGQGPGLGGNGGSGGGNAGGTPQQLATGNTPPVSPPQGNNGGLRSPSPDSAAGGGGGATAVGATASGTTSANGGAGATTSITNSSTTYSGGGGGGAAPGRPVSPGSGGAGGGGGGNGCNGSTNTGGGGGGSQGTGTCGGTGGSGIVVIRYKFQ